jgi:hypothetical membrane protein
MAFKLKLKLKLDTIASNPFCQALYFLAALALVLIGAYHEKIWFCNIGGMLIAIPIGWTFYQTVTQIFLPKEH